MSKFNKKGKNLCAVDGWLENLGFYRKNVAYDETCLFRAVSEQLYNGQIDHERVRKECISYARDHYHEFAYLIESEEKWEERLSALENHMLFCSPIELQVISSTYQREIIIFDGVRQEVKNVTQGKYLDALFLCLMEEDHYDVVYTKEYIVDAGFCQSIIYKIFYEKVFNIPDVDDIVRSMLYEKHNLITHNELVSIKAKNDSSNNMIAPFPFKVAKALDPNIYRNIEYDAWGDVRRELRLGEWYYGDDKLILGTRCLFNDSESDESFECYIQDIKDSDKCVVYLTKTAEKRTVNYSDLSPEDGAKPWPLPYRFTKNLNLATSTPQIPFEERSHRYKKRNKDKKRTKSESGIAILAATPESIDVLAYVGIPLQMQNQETVSLHQTPNVSTESQTDPIIPESGPPEEPVVLAQSPQWHYVPPSPDPFVWPPPATPPQPFGFGLKPMIASAPVTPSIVPYHDAHYPYYCNYHVDSYIYNQNWSTTPEPGSSQDDSSHNLEEQCCGIKTETTAETMNSETPEKLKLATNLKLCTTLSPQSPPVEMYSPIMQIPPGTPVIYTPVPMSEPDVLISAPQVVYSPQLEMPCLPPPPYLFPPTPPAAWYPPGVNAQGFIYPK